MVPAPSPARPSAKQKEDCYKVLGVPFDASEEEINKAYRQLALLYHPDRTGEEESERFCQVKEARRVLESPASRIEYDLKVFGRTSLGNAGCGTSEELLMKLLQERALQDIEHMQISLERVLRKEKAVRGVLIQKALYGNLQLRKECVHLAHTPERRIRTDDLVGPWIDVTQPLQNQVVGHKVILHGSANASKADLPGFYNPVPLDQGLELSLYVLYDFRGALHEVIVGDRDTLALPARKHAVPPEGPRGPFCKSNLVILRQHAAAEASNDSIAREKVLAKAVEAYRLQRLLGSDRDVGRREFFIVRALLVLGAGVALTLAMWRAARDDRDSRC
eukprot:TRINITY_DN52391_c0_g1_i1.p1 TRINITY_DN52391_c0_g1~~TRINITY_DN52391_c0_g1_i1.p1  ORF type:complete len:354 (-),score=62.66 TRINITY_DN52391_c0_g1_i1:10-1011(-)